jgi:hypothetical protein
VWDWWAPPAIRVDRSPTARDIRALVVGQRKFGAPLLHSSDGRAWEMHPLQYTRAWRVSYRYMKAGQALIICSSGAICSSNVWPLSAREVDEHVRAVSAAKSLTFGQMAAALERALNGAPPLAPWSAR